MAAKQKTVFFCKECGYETSKWLGQCPGCKSWDSFVEEPAAKKSGGSKALSGFSAEPVKLSDVGTGADERIQTGIGEFDRVLGGGMVKGSLVLVGGDPGIGKSTLLLQVCKSLAEKEKKLVYVSGEESAVQIKMRADRLGVKTDRIWLLSETNLEKAEEVLLREKPEAAIIDSIQTMFSDEVSAAPGSVSQIREATGSLLRLAKENGITIFIVGHVTKEGVVAGPRVLEHMVDTVLYFEGDNSASYRVLRSVKNRFGSTNEIGVFEMRSEGLAEIKNPSEYLLSGMPEDEPGSVITVTMEGTRPILIEVQALVSKTNMNIPRRTAAGTDQNRMSLLMAVMEKRLGIQLGFCDAFVNVAGGMKITEPALDLGIVLAILSSYKNNPLPEKTAVFGEVGLIGEVRSVSMAEQRVREAEKMGYKKVILPAVNAAALKKMKNAPKLELIGISNVKELMKGIQV